VLLALCAGASVGRRARRRRSARRPHGFSPAVLGYILFDAAVQGPRGSTARTSRSSPPRDQITTALAALEILGSDSVLRPRCSDRHDRRRDLARDLYLRARRPDAEQRRSAHPGRRAAARRRARVEGAFHFDESLYPRSAEIDALSPRRHPYNPR